MWKLSEFRPRSLQSKVKSVKQVQYVVTPRARLHPPCPRRPYGTQTVSTGSVTICAQLGLAIIDASSSFDGRCATRSASTRHTTWQESRAIDCQRASG